MPKISVIMGVYNGSKRIKNAIDSILNQTFTDFELIICDDGSTDNSIEIIKDIASNDGRIKLIENDENKSLAPTLNKCLKEARGEYIARMDDDDISHPYRFEKQVDFLDKYKDYAIVGTSRNMYDDGGVWGEAINEGERSKIDIYLGKSFVHPSVMMRRKEVLDVEGYSTSLKVQRVEDFDLWCRLYEAGYKGYNLKDILLDYYEAEDSYDKRKFKFRIGEYRLKKRWRRRLNIPIKYAIYSYKSLIVGLIPTKLLIKYHKIRFTKL